MTGAPQGKPVGKPTGKSASLSKDLPTGSVTFLFTDIQGSTSMWERDAARMQQALVRHDEILRTIVTEHGGHVFKMVGDACYAVFSSAPEALRAAVAAQKAIFKEPWDERSRVRIRMALHTGEAEERDGDYFGPPLNRVARLLSAGHGGQTLISKATKELVEEHLPQEVSLRDMGERRLKDLKEPERIFQLLAPDLPAEFPPLKTLETSSNEDRYRLIEKIGSGGMAEVYLAYDEFLQREVAFKVLDRKYAENKEAIERFRREARNAASLRHPNIVATHDRGETENGTYYIVMEYLEGGTLEDLIEGADGPLPPREAAEIALEIADALTVAHENDVIHRDIKPQNILLSATGEAKVADFGIARAASATTMTQAGSILGTVHYISPEQALGDQASPKSDLYSLGVVLYEMLTGELPYEAETPVGVIMKHVSGLTHTAREENPLVPEDLDDLVSRLLTKDPEERPPDAATLAQELEEISQSLPEVPEAERVRGTTTRGAGSGMHTTGSGTRRGTRGGTSGGTKRGRIGTGGRAGGGGRMAPSRGAGRGLQLRGVILAAALVLLSVGVIGAVALFQGGWPFAAQAQTLPEPTADEVSAPLAPGKYTTPDFEPEFSFKVGDGWWTTGDIGVYFDLLPQDEDARRAYASESMRYSALEFNRIETIYDPGRQGEINRGTQFNADLVSPAPEEIITWLQQHPYLDTSEPAPVMIGDRQGVRIDAEVSPVPMQSSDLCGPDPCIILFGLPDGGVVGIPVGGKSRLIVLKDIEGKTVIIGSNAYPASKFDNFIPKAQKVLDTVEWKTSP